MSASNCAFAGLSNDEKSQRCWLNSCILLVFNTRSFHNLWKATTPLQQLLEADSSCSWEQKLLRAVLVLHQRWTSCQAPSAAAVQKLLEQRYPEIFKRHGQYSLQQDAMEAWHLLIDNMATALHQCGHMQMAAEVKKGGVSQIATVMGCLTCNKQMVEQTDPPQQVLWLPPLPPNQQLASVAGAVQARFSRDIVSQAMCCNFNGQICAWRGPALQQLPSSLALHLMRFQTASASKDMREVAFGPTLDMQPFCSNNLQKATSCKYQLTGALMHKGKTIHAGHFWCFFKTRSGVWVMADDDVVQEVTQDFVLTHTSQVYAVFYEALEPLKDRAGGLLQIVQHSEGNAASAMAPAACPAGSFMLSGTAHRESPVLVEARQRASAYALATPHRKSAAYDIFAPPADGKAESETDTSSHSSTETADTDGVGSSANSDAGVVSDANSGVLHSLSRQALERLGRVSGQAYDVDSQEPAVAATQCNSPGSDTEASSTWRGSECQDSSGLDQAEFVQLSSRPRQSSGAGGGFRLPHRKKVLTVVGVAVVGFLIRNALKVHQQHLCKAGAKRDRDDTEQ